MPISISNSIEQGCTLPLWARIKCVCVCVWVCVSVCMCVYVCGIVCVFNILSYINNFTIIYIYHFFQIQTQSGKMHLYLCLHLHLCTYVQSVAHMYQDHGLSIPESLVSYVWPRLSELDLRDLWDLLVGSITSSLRIHEDFRRIKGIQVPVKTPVLILTGSKTIYCLKKHR